jgi:hypothetical protein
VDCRAPLFFGRQLVHQLRPFFFDHLAEIAGNGKRLPSRSALPFAAQAAVHIGARDDRAAATTRIGKKLNGQVFAAIKRVALPKRLNNFELRAAGIW